MEDHGLTHITDEHITTIFKGFLTGISKEFELIHGLQKGQNGFQCGISLKIHTQGENIFPPIRGSDKSTTGTILVGEVSL
jgi:hypothetical protein